MCVPDYFTALLYGALVNESSSRRSSTNLSLLFKNYRLLL